MPSAGWWPAAPRIVAESLAAVPDPIRTSLRAGPLASGAEVARALARALTPPLKEVPAPTWLLSGQVRGFRRTLAALEHYGGAILADPVGSGKTYVALAVAAALHPGRAVACLVPATLAEQWRAVAARLGVAIEVGTHEQCSRGRFPGVTRGLVVIDESHHFRHPQTRRYLYVAPWLVGRTVLMLSATPIVNRLEDLAHQLLLGVRDDALIADGVTSMRHELVECGRLSALGRIVLEDTAGRGPRPERTSWIVEASSQREVVAARALQQLNRLRLSAHPPTAALVRGVLFNALASSPAALAGALRRYRNLLLHARDAHRAGRRLTRAELRRFTGPAEEQLVLWELLADGAGESELALDDLALVDQVTAATTADVGDPKADHLRSLLADGRPTLVFVTRRETVRYLRDRLGPPAVAWCTGERAGLGHVPAPRAAVLDWFRDDRAKVGPQCLIVTDVAAEGLDLRRAARVVHYDLPWTPMRLEQREGRAVRLGSARVEVEVVRFEPPSVLDTALRLGASLARKAALPARAGLGADGRRLWRWRSALADQIGDGACVAGTAVVTVMPQECGPGLLAGYELHAARGGVADCLAAVVGWLDPAGRWFEDESIVTTRLLAALESTTKVPCNAARAAAALDRLAGPIRAHLTRVAGRRWTAAEPDPAARKVAVRLGSGVREAARRRDAHLLAKLERALAFVAGGHTAGEALMVRRLAGAEPRALERELARLPLPTPRWGAVEVVLTGLVLFERELAGGQEPRMIRPPRMPAGPLNSK